MGEPVTMDIKEEIDMISFGIVAAAGQARSLAFEALEAAHGGDFNAAERCLLESQQALNEAHRQQTNLLSKEAGGDHTPVDVLLIHAQDHLMTGILAQELISELVFLHKIIGGKQ